VVTRLPLTLLAASALAAGGCSDPPSDDDSAVADASVEVILSELIPTVATVRWTPTDDHDAAYVTFGHGACEGTRAPAAVGEDGRLAAALVGMKPSSSYCLRAVEERGDDVLVVGEEDLVTGDLPADIAEPTLALAEPAAAAPGFTLTTLATIPAHAIIVDPDGDVVWWHRPQVTANSSISRLRLSRDGATLMYLATVGLQVVGHSAEQHLVRVALDGAELEPLWIPDAHHDFAELPDGSMAFITYDSRQVLGDRVHGDRIVEIRPDGAEVEVFTVWDHFTYDADSIGHPALGWTHANALHHDEIEDVYYLSLNNLDTVVKVDRSSGDLLWQLGGDDSSFATDGPLFQRQHQVHPLDDGNLLLFANGTTELQNSRAVEIALDESAWTAEVVWEHSADPPLFVYSFGDVQRFASGLTAITWSTSGRIDQVTPGHDVVSELSLPLGNGFGYSEWVESLY